MFSLDSTPHEQGFQLHKQPIQFSYLTPGFKAMGDEKRDDVPPLCGDLRHPWHTSVTSFVLFFADQPLANTFVDLFETVGSSRLSPRKLYLALRKRADPDYIKKDGQLCDGGDLRTQSNQWVRSAFQDTWTHTTGC